MKSICLLVLFVLFIYSAPAFCNKVEVTVQVGDTAALIQAIKDANALSAGNPDALTVISFVPGPNGENEFKINMVADGYENGLPDITGRIDMVGTAGSKRVLFRGTGQFRLVNVAEHGFLQLEYGTLDSFGRPGGFNQSGGAILVQDMAYFAARDAIFSNNFASENGAAIAATGSSHIEFNGCLFRNNSASSHGGSIAIEGSATALIEGSRFDDDHSSGVGCDVYLNSDGVWVDSEEGATLTFRYSVFSSACDNVLIGNLGGSIRGWNNTLATGVGPALEFATESAIFGNLFAADENEQHPESNSGSLSKPESVCEGSGTIESLGYNISPDDSCHLDQPTDKPNTDPLVVRNEDGIPIPQPNSPAIDAGPANAMVIGDAELASLPCGYADILGTARPQDGNGDGVFECDMGAIEVAGTGDITDGHSGAFFNLDREGEGTYVEILNDSAALVYTFTYRPDGSGPAWFIGVGPINGNSIVIDDMLRPIGAHFGDAFDSADVELWPIGGMSMVFPDCTAGASPGSVAYSGNPDLGYEGLITKALRLSNITGCGSEVPSPKVGLSGSYYDPARNFEGVIVEWLTSGDVLAVFFTYDLNGNQLWLLGIGTPNGNSVTMDALYASTFTKWGSGFDPGEVTISKWGTFTLTWTGCDAVTFDYSSTVPGYGSASHNYQRLTRLQNTSCPAF